MEGMIEFDVPKNMYISQAKWVDDLYDANVLLDIEKNIGSFYRTSKKTQTC